jgi:septal ring factor EnvC (AmiA/AmiB activator)
LEHEGELMANELEHLRDTNKNLDASKFNFEKAMSESTLKLQCMARELKEKEDIVDKLNYMLKDNSDNRFHLEDHVGLLKSSSAKLEDKLHASAQEINKGN